MKTEPLITGNFYHLYNRGNNGSDIFKENDNYLYFLSLYDKYITPVADTYAWCLMRNHFHILVYLKNENEIDTSLLSYSTVEYSKKLNPSKQFSHLFNAYSQAFNKRYSQTGSLFEKPFERKKVCTEKYFVRLIYYIHNNPVHHGFVNSTSEYQWSSYHSIVSKKQTKLMREQVLSMFDSIENFIYYHTLAHDLSNINDVLIDY